MYANSCAPACGSTPILIQIPGVPGLPGTPGTPGATGATGAAGANGLSPSLISVSAYGSGNVFAVPAPAALVTFGGGSPVQPVITLTAGTWLLWAHMRFDFLASSPASPVTITGKIHCINNTVQDIPNTVKGWQVPQGGPYTQTAGDINIAPVQYVATAGDQLALYAGLSVATGGVNCSEADIIALQLAGGSGSLGGLAGIGSPNGVVTAPAGTPYIDITNPLLPIVYFKTNPPLPALTNTGWVAVIS